MPKIAVEKRQEYAEGRRDQILNAALQVFSNRGFAETTMDEIAAASRLGKGTLYCYFPSKEVLLEKLVARYVLLPEVPELVAEVQESPPAVGIPALVIEVWRRLKERMDLARVVVREVYSNPERARLVTEHVNLRGARAFADYLSLWMKRGELEPTDPLTTAQCLFGMLWSFLLSQEVMNQKDVHPLSDGQICSIVSHVFVRGVMRRPDGLASAKKPTPRTQRHGATGKN
jgi:AcrR family transcriptional regulator